MTLLWVLAAVASIPPLCWVRCAVARGYRERHVPGALVRAALSTYAALVTLLAVVALVLLSLAFGAGEVIAIVLSPFAMSTAASAELLWDAHAQVAAWLAAVPLGLAAVVLHRVDGPGWVELLAAGRAVLAAAVLLRARRTLGHPPATARCQAWMSSARG